MKITIIGYSGSGKTTLAKRISGEFSIPHQQIDRVWFEAGGHKAKTDTDKEKIRQIIIEAVTEFSKQKDWVSDGFYSRAQSVLADQADYVIVIELPLTKRLINHWKRILKRDGRHTEVTILKDFLHSYQIIKRTFTFRQKLESFKQKYEDKLVLLKSFRETDAFFEKLRQTS